MAKKLYEESNIQAIADAIREKNGETTTYKPSEMAAAITAITTGGGDIEVEPIVLSGDQPYGCSGSIASNYIKLFGDTITTKDLIGSIERMFHASTLEYIPFEINCKNTNDIQVQFLFNNAYNLKALPKINGCSPSNITSFCTNCHNLREIPDDYFDNWDFNNSYMANNTSSYSGMCNSMFQNCNSLRRLPLYWASNLNPYISNFYSFYNYGFSSCFVLDEIVDLPVPFTKATWTSNTFNGMVSDCRRLKRLTFATKEDGTPIVVQWKAQTIDLTKNVGFYEVSMSADPEQWDTITLESAIRLSEVTNRNSGITADKAVYNIATYETLKDDPDAFFLSSYYYRDRYYFSRYNRISAVETINSLPDTSAYLATAGGTNTIKFKGMAGLGTDGGAINTLTEEEIAVAAAKGWTVSLV